MLLGIIKARYYFILRLYIPIKKQMMSFHSKGEINGLFLIPVAVSFSWADLV